jgi:hypothetical protein
VALSKGYPAHPVLLELRKSEKSQGVWGTASPIHGIARNAPTRNHALNQHQLHARESRATEWPINAIPKNGSSAGSGVG